MVEGIIYILAYYGIHALGILVGFVMLSQLWDWSDESDRRHTEIQDEIDYNSR